MNTSKINDPCKLCDPTVFERCLDVYKVSGTPPCSKNFVEKFTPRKPKAKISGGRVRSHNKSSPKLPTLDECYKVIPFPKDEHECAYFCAGLVEMHKFIAGKIGR